MASLLASLAPTRLTNLDGGEGGKATHTITFPLPPWEYVRLCAFIEECLSATVQASDVWLEDFKQAQGYEFFTDVLLALEVDPFTANYVDAVLETVSQLVYVGKEPISTSQMNSPYYAPGPVLTAPGASDTSNTVRNLAAFQVLQNYFLKSRDVGGQFRLKVLDCLLAIYAADYSNFVLLQQLHTLAHFLEAFHTFPLPVQDGILRVLVFVGTVVHSIPFQELSALSLLLMQDDRSDEPPPFTTVLLVYQTVNKLVNFEPKYKKIFQEAGLLLMLMNLLKDHFAVFLHHQSSLILLSHGNFHYELIAATEGGANGSCGGTGSDKRSAVVKTILAKEWTPLSEEDLKNRVACFTVVMDTLSLLLDGVEENVNIFRMGGCRSILFCLLQGQKKLRMKAAVILKYLLRSKSSLQQGDAPCLLDVIRMLAIQASCRQGDNNAQIELCSIVTDVMNLLRGAMSTHSRVARAFFQSEGGAVVVFAMAAILRHAFGPDDRWDVGLGKMAETPRSPEDGEDPTEVDEKQLGKKGEQTQKAETKTQTQKAETKRKEDTKKRDVNEVDLKTAQLALMRCCLSTLTVAMNKVKYFRYLILAFFL